MPVRLELAGKCFGWLTAREPTGDTDKFGNRLWHCDCKCGKTKIVGAGLLTKGEVKSCGCRHKGKAWDLTDQPFGYLTARRVLKKRDKFGNRLWHCDCKCGGSTVLSAHVLLQGATKSCGCARGGRPLNLTGKRYGILTALTMLRQKKYGLRLWSCKCDCGQTKVVSSSDLRSGSVKSCGCLNRMTKGNLKAEYKQREKIIVDDEEWWSPGCTARYLGVNVSTTAYWKISCPLLGGKPLRAESQEGTMGRQWEYFHAKTVKQAKANWDAAEPVPKLPGLVYLKDALLRMGCSIDTLRKRAKDDRVKIEKRTGKGKDGRARRRAYVPASFVNKYATAESPPLPTTTERTEGPKAPDGIRVQNVLYDGFSALEHRLLVCLWNRTGVPVAEVIESVYGIGYDGKEGSLNSLVKHLNSKLEKKRFPGQIRGKSGTYTLVLSVQA